MLAPSAEVAANFTGLLLQYQGTPLVDVYRARASIEVSVLVELVGRGAAKRLDALQAEIDKGADLIGDAVQFARWDARMHSMIVELGENKALTVIASMLFHIVSRHNEQFVASHESEQARPAHRAAHRAYSKLVKLLREGDVPAAQSFWRKHLDGVEKYMVGSSDTTLVEILS
ncbi:FadR/GntR family transcriptional regulator [Rhodococcus erythropolis]|uniref:FadR/GntR family transcriptional regulator n=1 Tax=Rhodococcus erythropolis TaxID=1833 RepID=UPI0037A3200E